MLTNDDKKWITDLIAPSEERIAARMERMQTSLLNEFEKWKLPAIDPRVEAAASRTMNLELEALRRLHPPLE